MLYRLPYDSYGCDGNKFQHIWWEIDRVDCSDCETRGSLLCTRHDRADFCCKSLDLYRNDYGTAGCDRYLAGMVLGV